eukprot:TRINITY_DN19741_c0_g1_i1.p1 TRINITY_DN19741_c0_g1~~TRINITY_DN19741_c0_g1_i1.p1  ORF type:complete len:124 (-),score=13.82 TRINITY_DN19741_c0_g1_i1:26-397(-)
MQTSSSFARMMVSFCMHLEWFCLSSLLDEYVKRLGFGIRQEIIPLVEIKGVRAARARALYAAGFRTVRSVANARVEDLIKAIPKLGLFGVSTAKSIINNARKLLEDKAAELRREAEEMLKLEG